MKRCAGAGVLACLLVVTHTDAQAQIEWFVPQGTSYLLARAHASIGMDTQDRCTVAMLNRPKVCAWCDQFNRCRQQTPSATAPFNGREEVVVEVRRPPALDASTRSSTNLDAAFSARSLRLAYRVATAFENRGKSVPSNRGTNNASGEIFFRVPTGAPLRYELAGTLRWKGTNGHLQLIGVPNTGANSDGFSFNTNHLKQGVPADLAKTGSLTPGVYRLFWFLTADQISHGGAIEGSVELDLKFGDPQVASNEVCREIFPRTPPRQTLAPASTATRAATTPASPRFDPDAKAVDIDFGSTPAFALITREDITDAGLPLRSCVISAHGNPDSIWYLNTVPIPLGEAVKVIRRYCGDDEPVVLLACETGRPKTDGSEPVAQRLANEMKLQGRRETTVWAPSTLVAAGGGLASDPSIVLPPVPSGYPNTPVFQAPGFIEYRAK